MKPKWHDVSHAIADVSDRIGFQEVFGGNGGHTQAVRRQKLTTLEALDLDNCNLLDYAEFKKILKQVRLGRIRWLHGGPPCRTFSRARKRD